MSEPKTKPDIRFAGFRDSWERPELRAVAEFNPKSVVPDSFEYVDLESVVGTDMVGHRTEIKASAPSRAQRLAEKDDIFYQTVRPYQKNNYLFALSCNNYVFSTGYAQIRPNINSQFLFSRLQEERFMKAVLDRCTGTGYPAINATDLSEIKVTIPVDKQEQIKIGAIFKYLDSLITLQQREYDKTVSIKKAMLEKMFPKAGADRPEIRFAGFTAAWEQRKLGDMMEISSVTRVHQSDWKNEGVRFLRARDIVAASKGEEVSEYLYISREKYNEYTKISGKVILGDLLVTGVGSIGVPMLIKHEKPLYFKDGNVIWFKNENKSFDGHFFYYSFIGRSIQQYIRDVAGIGTVGTYTIESGKKTPMQYPTWKEQKQIGSFFANLDNLITLHQGELTKLQNMKKALLEKMFV